jgi:hypothetical protein
MRKRKDCAAGCVLRRRKSRLWSTLVAVTVFAITSADLLHGIPLTPANNDQQTSPGGEARMEEGNKLSSWATGMQSRSEMMYRYGNDAATRCLNAKKQKLKLNYHHAK